MRGHMRRTQSITSGNTSNPNFPNIQNNPSQATLPNVLQTFHLDNSRCDCKGLDFLNKPQKIDPKWNHNPQTMFQNIGSKMSLQIRNPIPNPAEGRLTDWNSHSLNRKQQLENCMKMNHQMTHPVLSEEQIV